MIVRQPDKHAFTLPTNVVIQFPSGRWGFVGHVDARLAYAMKDGSPVAAPLIAELRESSNPGMVESLRGVVTRTWGTEAEALAAAQEVA
jgi:hypothetical protein